MDMDIQTLTQELNTLSEQRQEVRHKMFACAISSCSQSCSPSQTCGGRWTKSFDLMLGEECLDEVVARTLSGEGPMPVQVSMIGPLAGTELAMTTVLSLHALQHGLASLIDWACHPHQWHQTEETLCVPCWQLRCSVLL